MAAVTVLAVNPERLPIERRSLTGPAVVTETGTLTELVSMMKKSCSAVTEVLAAAEESWHARSNGSIRSTRRYAWPRRWPSRSASRSPG